MQILSRVDIATRRLPMRGFCEITSVSTVSSAWGFSRWDAEFVFDKCIVTVMFCFAVNHIKCPLCDMTCTSLSTLKIHIKFRHCDERPFPCDFCESRWLARACVMSTYDWSTENKNMPLILYCVCCCFSFKNQHDLRRHMETHNEGAAYHCTVEGCGYSSRMAHTMNQHYKRVHEVSQQGVLEPHVQHNKSLLTWFQYSYLPQEIISTHHLTKKITV